MPKGKKNPQKDPRWYVMGEDQKPSHRAYTIQEIRRLAKNGRILRDTWICPARNLDTNGWVRASSIYELYPSEESIYSLTGRSVYEVQRDSSRVPRIVKAFGGFLAAAILFAAMYSFGWGRGEKNSSDVAESSDLQFVEPEFEPDLTSAKVSDEPVLKPEAEVSAPKLKPPKPDLPSTVTVDLLKNLDLSVLPSRGDWALTPDGLSSTDRTTNAQIMIPFEVPLDYTLEADFIRRSGKSSFSVTIPVGDSGTTFSVDAYPERGGRIGISRSPHIQWGSNGVIGQQGVHVTNGKRHQVGIHVQATSQGSASVTATFDGEPVLDWSGDLLELGEYHSFAPPNGFCIGAWDGDMLVKRLELKYESNAKPRPKGEFLRFLGNDSLIIGGFNYTGKYPITIEMEVTPEELGRYQYLMGNCAYDTGGGLRLNIFDDNRIGFSTVFNTHLPNGVVSGTRLLQVISDEPLEKGKKIHIAASCDGKLLRLFINGKLQNATKPVTGTYKLGRAFLVGASPRKSNDTYAVIHRSTFRGLIHSVHIRNAARTQSFSVKNTHQPASASVVCYQLDGVNEVTVPNLAGDKYLGIIRGARPTNRVLDN